MESLIAQCRDKNAKKKIEALAEAFKYSDPVSSDATYSIEQSMSKVVTQIYQSVYENNVDEISFLCEKLAELLVQRNRVCRLNKN